MKAVIQNFRRGDLAIKEIPAPALRPGGVLVRNAFSLVSPGTERLMVGLAQKSLLGKAQARPDLVRQVFEKALRDGFLATIEAVRHRLDSPVPLGYSSAGTVIAVGEGAAKFRRWGPGCLRRYRVCQSRGDGFYSTKPGRANPGRRRFRIRELYDCGGCCPAGSPVG